MSKMHLLEMPAPRIISVPRAKLDDPHYRPSYYEMANTLPGLFLLVFSVAGMFAATQIRTYNMLLDAVLALVLFTLSVAALIAMAEPVCENVLHHWLARQRKAVQAGDDIASLEVPWYIMWAAKRTPACMRPW